MSILLIVMTTTTNNLLLPLYLLLRMTSHSPVSIGHWLLMFVLQEHVSCLARRNGAQVMG